MKRSYLWLLALWLTWACKEKESFPLGGDTNAKVQIIDTFSVELSTVLVDSLPTSGSEKLLVGKLDNAGTGKVTAMSYFQLSLSNRDVNSDGIEDILQYISTPVYDSLVLIMNHHYTYGDTLAARSMKVYRVKETMASNSASVLLYNSSYFPYDETILGETTPDFRNSNELHLKLSDQLGMELFSLAKDRDYKVANNTYFKDYFKGLVLVPDVSAKSIYGYSSDIVVRLFYHDSESPANQKQYDFILKETDVHFNRLLSDRSATGLSSLKERYQEIAAKETNNEAYLLTGIELMPKIKLPTVNDIALKYPFAAVNRAELIIHPKIKTYDASYALPQRLVLYATNNTNIPGTAIAYTNSYDVQIISPTVDWESQELTYYKFDLTDFITNKIINSNKETALMLASSKAESASRVERLILSGDRNAQNDIKLKLYLTSFK